MVKKITLAVVDDLDSRSAADETVEFELDGVGYEVDLSAANAQKLRAELRKWVNAARRVGGRRKPRSANPTLNHRAGSAAVRLWARRNGYDLTNHGRIPYNILEAYRLNGR